MITRRPADRSRAARAACRAGLAAPLAAFALAGCGNKGDLYLDAPDGDGAPVAASALPGLEALPDGSAGRPGTVAAPAPAPAAGAPVAGGDPAADAERPARRAGRRTAP